MQGRRQSRISRRFLAQIFSAHDALHGEAVSVENVSLHGARVATVRAWIPGSPVVVKFISGEMKPKSAQVVYCQAVSDKEFGVGLEFLSPWL